MAVAPSLTINLPPAPVERLDSAASVAALRALPSLTVTNGQNIALDGSNTVGDGGGGLYVWAELSTLADNGFTVIRPDDVEPNDSGRWILTGSLFDLTPPAGPWSFTATAGQTVYTATGSTGLAIEVDINDQRVVAGEDYTHIGDVITFLIPLSAGDFVEIAAPTIIGSVSFTASSISTPIPGGTVQNFITSRSREIWITDAPWLADPTGVQDAAPAFRLARNYLSSIGGGVIRMPPRSTFALNSSETITIWEIDAQETRAVCLTLPAGVSLIGAGRETTKIRRTGGGLTAIIATLDGANQTIGGFELHGPGGSNNSQHGIFNFSATSYAHVLENVHFANLYIHDVGSYGIGNNLVCKDVTVKGVKTLRTGADGIDWKQRGVSLATMNPSYTVFDDIDIDKFAQRSGAGTPTGIGFRGPVTVSNIQVRGIPPGLAGIDFVAGIVVGVEVRVSASRSSITNWYAEGADPKAADAIGLRVYACEGVRVGVGTAKYARCEGVGPTATPYGFDDGGLFEGATVIPAHGRTAFLATTKSTHFRGARVISDKVYWDAKRGNLVAGQTVLPLPWASTIANSVNRYLVKINGSTRTILTETTHYSWTTNSVTLVTPAAADDQYFAVFPPQYGFRIEADNCSVLGVQDYFVPSRISIPVQSYADSGEFHVMWEGRANLGQINSDTVMGLFARDPTVTNKPLVFQAQGSGAVSLGAAVNEVAFFSGSGALKQTVTGTTADEKIASLIAALAAYGQITDSTT